MSECIICDSREKKNAHILAWFKRCEIPYKIQKMDVADYQIEGRDAVVIDRKQNLDELCSNLTSTKQYPDSRTGKKKKSDKARFKDEVIKAYKRGMKLYVLIEHGGGYKSIRDVARWKNKYGRVQGRELMEIMEKMHIAYGTEFLFCSKSETGQRIIELLRHE